MIEALRAVVQARIQEAITPLAQWLASLKISPNHVTVAGFLLTLVSAGLLMSGYRLSAGLVFLLASSFDLLDGALARVAKQATTFGGFLDSTLDRVGEGAMFMAIAYRLALHDDALAVAAVVLAMLGAMLTSYTRARAEVVGMRCNVGWVSRPERVILITMGLLFDVIAGVIYVLVVLTLWTAGQRIMHVYKGLRAAG